ncbi:Hypothetical protein PHPALM_859 [Phytophthora palmivora]|uniref:Transmembrane protein n=1 Tax=Phytophthora palmivora TaxID=4796 RepID=A0A2P4YTR9_9STRA|nr:Hypothetical protein PHPALM_859 [Phytophthora palmivora]
MEDITCAWIANACYSLGNIFSGKPSRDQSRNELIVANALWATITFCVVVLIARLPSMLSLQFIETPDSKPTVWFCLKKLFRGTLVYFFATLVGMLACSAFIAYLISIKPSLFKYKFDCYVGTLSTHGFFTGITLTAKRIYYRETCQGQKRLLLGQEAEADANQSRRKAISFRSAYSVRSFKFWRAYIKEFPKSMPAALAGVFVHILSQQRIMERGPTILTCFVVASTVFKLTIQESTKHYILKKRIRNIKFMCAAVALPTVLIDTQTRIILLGSKSTGLVAMGTLGMALMEICLRVSKAAMIVKIIRKREATVFKSKTQILTRPSVSSVRISSVSSPSPVRVDFELWRKRLHSYHIAEVNADTYAEYIAIGCSASIMFFFGDHPHYSLLSQSDSVDHGRQRSMQLKILVFQVWIEIVVDFVSTLLEMMAGIDYDLIKNLGPFLTVLFVVTAVLNINISVAIVMRNAAGSVACAWLVNAFYSLGNIFSGKPSREQSRRELIAANSAWALTTFSIITLLAQVPLLLSLRFLDAPDHRPTLWYCLKKLVRVVAIYFFASMAIMLGWSCFVGYLTTANPALFKYKLDCYVNTLTTHGMFTGIALTIKKIYYHESCQGRDRLTQAQHKQKPSAKKLSSPASPTSNHILVVPRKQSLSYWRVYFREFPKSMPAAIAGIFVHILSQQRIMDRGNLVITCFVVASIVVKFVTLRIRSIRIMCAAVSLPTVLIDTQTRIILLGTQSTHLLALDLSAGWKNPLRHANYLSSRNQYHFTPQINNYVLEEKHYWEISLKRSNTRNEYEMQGALGVSTSNLANKITGSLRVFKPTGPQLPILGFQVLVEIIVDFLSTALEIMAGVQFDMNKNVAAFLAIFLAAIAVVNINISVGLYLY